MDNCIFCDIVSGKEPCYKIYENEYALAILDILNDCSGHTLVIPKKHYESVLDCDKFYLEQVILAVQTVSNHYVNNCGFDGVNIMNASGDGSEQSIFICIFISCQGKSRMVCILSRNFQKTN